MANDDLDSILVWRNQLPKMTGGKWGDGGRDWPGGMQRDYCPLS